MISQHLINNSGGYNEYINLKELFKFSSNNYFIFYLNDIYNELSFRIPKEIKTKEKKVIIPTGLTDIIFSEYLNFQFYICDKLFKCLEKQKDGFLHKQDFVNGIYNLYLGSFNDCAQIIFSLFDFNHDGIINKDDMKLLLSYIPQIDNEYKKQIQFLKGLDKIIEETFDGEKELLFKEYLNSLKNKNSESFLQLMIYFYKNKPFDIETISLYQFKRKQVSKNHFNFQSKLNFSPNRNELKNQKEKKLFQSLRKNRKSTSNDYNKSSLTNISSKYINHQNSTKQLPIPITLFKENQTSSSSSSLNILKKSSSKPFFLKKTLSNKNSPNEINPIYKKVNNFPIGKSVLLQNLKNKRKSKGESTSNNSKDSSSNLPLLSQSPNLSNNTNPKSNRVKYKLSPVFKVFSKFSPPTVSHNIENEPEEPPEFFLCDDDNNCDDFKLEIQEDDKNDNLENDKKNNDNEEKKNFSKKLDSYRKFKASLPKFNFNLEDYVFKYDDSKISVLKKYFCAVKDCDLLFFSSNLKNELNLIINIKGAYIKKGENIIVAKEIYYTLIIIFSNNKKKYLYFLNDIIRNKWFNKLKDNNNNYDFNEFYILNEQIGEGYFGKVQKGINKNTRKEVAVKVINKSKLSYKNYKLIHHEMNIMKLLNHPHIVSLEDYFEDDEYIYIVMNYLSGGDLLEYIEKKDELISEKEAAKIIKEIAKGIKYMHLFGLVHRDLKPENIVFENKNDIESLKIIDFGLTKTLASQEKTNEAIGTLTYLAPEVFSHKPYDNKIDIWSIGIILFFLLSGCLPFDDENNDENIIGKKVVFSQQEYPKEYFGNRNINCLKLIDKCLEKKPEKRISIDEFLKNDWVNRASN